MLETYSISLDYCRERKSWGVVAGLQTFVACGPFQECRLRFGSLDFRTKREHDSPSIVAQKSREMEKPDSFGLDNSVIRETGDRESMGMPRIRAATRSLPWEPAPHPVQLIPIRPLYQTDFGVAYAGDALDALRHLPDGSIDAVITSPPYALHFKKE